MKKSFLLLVVGLLAFQTLQAQISLGMKGGISSLDIEPGELVVSNSDAVDNLRIAVDEANYGAHFGLFIRAKMGRFFLQPEILFNSNSVDYRITDFSNGGATEIIKTESFQNLDLPILMGVKYGPFRMQGGPIAHVHLSSTSELFDIEGYEQKFNEMTWGYQAGVGLDIWRLNLDLRYEGGFNNFGDHMNFFGNELNFDKNPGKVVASVGWRF